MNPQYDNEDDEDDEDLPLSQRHTYFDDLSDEEVEYDDLQCEEKSKRNRKPIYC